MIPNHKQFIEAIAARNKVCLRFYSTADSQVVDHVCAPLEYGPGAGAHQNGVNRYWLWDYSCNTGPATCAFLPEQVIDLRILGEPFDPSEFNTSTPNVAGSSSGTVGPASEPVTASPTPL